MPKTVLWTPLGSLQGLKGRHINLKIEREKSNSKNWNEIIFDANSQGFVNLNLHWIEETIKLGLATANWVMTVGGFLTTILGWTIVTKITQQNLWEKKSSIVFSIGYVCIELHVWLESQWTTGFHTTVIWKMKLLCTNCKVSLVHLGPKSLLWMAVGFQGLRRKSFRTPAISWQPDDN